MDLREAYKAPLGAGLSVHDYATNNKYPNFPPLMSDGRSLISSYNSTAQENNDAIMASGNPRSAHEYRQYLIHNGEHIQYVNAMRAYNDAGYTKRPIDTTTHGPPVLYNSYLDTPVTPISDLAANYLSREQLNARRY